MICLSSFSTCIRAAYHDAGTFDQRKSVGGANGCLMNDSNMLNDLMGENKGLKEPMDTLREIKNNWMSANQCIDVSSADMIQFAAYFAVVRQMGDPRQGITQTKRNMMLGNTVAPGGVVFKWGRPDLDVHLCDEAWTDHLPYFSPAMNTRVENPDCKGKTPQEADPKCKVDFPNRCLAAGKEIKDKMMDGQGFTKDEAVALIGAHTIGQVREEFGPALEGPWVPNGADDATDRGPVFDNS